jgi:hypothetical protein
MKQAILYSQIRSTKALISEQISNGNIKLERRSGICGTYSCHHLVKRLLGEKHHSYYWKGISSPGYLSKQRLYLILLINELTEEELMAICES